MVMFDLPVETKKQRGQYTRFRNHLLKESFTGFQYSVYLRFCGSMHNLEAAKKRVLARLPTEGKVTFLIITDRQFGLMENYYCGQEAEKPKPTQQLELF